MSYFSDSSVAFPLPQLSASGCRVTLHKILLDDNGILDIKCIVKFLLMLGEIRLIEESPIAGDIVIFDVSVIKTSSVSKLIHPAVKKGIMCSQVRQFCCIREKKKNPLTAF